MTESIQKLYQISLKEKRKIIGLMSGTSFDGLDIALCEISGNGKNTQLQLLNFTTYPYTLDFRRELSSVISKKNIDMPLLCKMNASIGINHGIMVNNMLDKWGISNNEIDIIASHGQTVFHAPATLFNHEVNSTLQLGDGDHIAIQTGIITISDFRQKHIAARGEGAPLATYGDYLLFADNKKDRILLNIGGIANFTFIPSNADFKNVISTDTGPGNTLMDQLIRHKYSDKLYDNNAEIALKGKVNEQLFSTLFDHPFFLQPFPKTTGPELFNINFIQSCIEKSNTINIPFEDIMATLNKLTSTSICKAIDFYINESTDYEILISGGGIHNPLLMKSIQTHFGENHIKKFEELNFNPDAKEALLFAVLANEMIAGNKEIFEEGTKAMPNVSMGKISFPD